MIHQVRGRLGHAPAPTRRTQPAALARERDPPFVTAVAPYPQKSVRQDSAVEQRSELPPYEARHATSACLGTLDEASEVALYRAVDRGRFRPATHVAPRGRGTRRRGLVHVWRPPANRGPSRARATADVWRAQVASVAHGRATVGGCVISRAASLDRPARPGLRADQTRLPARRSPH